MNGWKYRKISAFILAMLFVCSIIACSLAEETENAPVPEETETDAETEEGIIAHCLWGFFVGWTEGDTGRMLRLCATEWKHGKADPGQELLKLLGSGKPRGYRINSISGEENEPYRTISVTVQRETENGEYAYGLYEITCRHETATDMYLGFVPEGFGSGVPAEPVPEEEMVMLTAEGMIRSALELHAEAGLYDRLVPIGAVTEKQGIRMEVIAGLVQEEEEWFLISVEDTEGRYSGNEMSPSFSQSLEESVSVWWSRVYSDGNKSIYMLYTENEQKALPVNSSVTVGLSAIWISESETFSLNPLLARYGKTEEGVRHPVLENRSYPDTPEVPEDEKVLDYQQPLDISLYEDVCLTGIGWIGDQLHIQFHQKGIEYLDMRNGRGSTCSVWVEGIVSGKTYAETDVGYSPLCWDGNGNGWSEWTEYVFNCKPEEAEQAEFSAEITVTKAILENDWNITVSRDAISIPSGT